MPIRTRKENETDDAHTNAEKAAARTVFLRGTNVLSADQMREIANRLTISFDVVSHFVQNDWKRVVNELTSDGTITRDDVTANRKRKAEMAQEKTDKRDRRELKKARRDAVDGRPERLVGLNAQTGSAAVRSTPDADTSEVADKLPADPMSQLGKVRLRWTREMDKALVMAVCRVQVVFGVPGGARKDIMRFAHSKGGGLPTDLERCRRRWQKLGRLKPGIMRAIDAFVPAMQGRGVLAREKAASERLLAVQRGDVPPADPNPDPSIPTLTRGTPPVPGASRSTTSSNVWWMISWRRTRSRTPPPRSFTTPGHGRDGTATRTRTRSGRATTRYRSRGSSASRPTIPTPNPSPSRPPRTNRTTTSSSPRAESRATSTARRFARLRTRWSSSKCSCRFATR